MHHSKPRGLDLSQHLLKPAAETDCPHYALCFSPSLCLFISLSLSPAAGSVQTIRFGVTNVPLACSAFHYDPRHCDLFLSVLCPVFYQV